MISFNELKAAYKAQHTNSTNKLMHLFGVPIVIFSIFMLLHWVNLDFGTMWKVSFTWLLVIVGAGYYFSLGVHKLAATTTVVMIFVLLIAGWVAGPFPTKSSGIIFIVLFVIGWALILTGHKIEKSKPAIMNSLWNLFIAPLFLVNELLEYCGLDQQFSELPNEEDQPKRPHNKHDNHHD